MSRYRHRRRRAAGSCSPASASPVVGRGTYRGGSTLISRSGWFFGNGKQKKDTQSSYPEEPKPVRRARLQIAKVVRADREVLATERTLRAVQLLRTEGLSDADIRRRLKIKRLP